MEARKVDGIGLMTANWPLDPTKSTIVFIHGAAGSGDFWLVQIEELAGNANTLAIDLPGHGRSNGDGLDTIEGYADFVIDLINKLDVPNPIPCGLSMGGAVVLQLILEYPDFLKAGILIGTGARLKVAPMIFEAIEKDYSRYVSMICDLVSSENMSSEILYSYRKSIERCRPEVTLKDFQACNGFDVMQRIDSISLPVLIVSAEDDRLTPIKYSEFLEKNIPGAIRSHIMEAGHILPMEKPEAFNRAVLQFLDRKKL